MKKGFIAFNNCEHVLYETGDKDVPDEIIDRNGEVCLALCKVCGGAEASLPTKCPGVKLDGYYLDLIQQGVLDFI